MADRRSLAAGVSLAPGKRTYGMLAGIARRSARGAPMEEVERVMIRQNAGLEGDYKGARHMERRVSLMTREAWEAALADLGQASGLGGPLSLSWTARRANLLISGLLLPEKPGSLIQVGSVLLEVTFPAPPCARMEAVHPGLRLALKQGRGGAVCRVLEEGEVAVGDPVLVS